MNRYFSRESRPTTLRYLMAYALFFGLSMFGLAVLIRVRTNILELCDFFSASLQVVPMLYTWGTYLLFILYMGCLVWIEAYINRSAANSRVIRGVLKVFSVEIGMLLLTGLISLLLSVPPHH